MVMCFITQFAIILNKCLMCFYHSGFKQDGPNHTYNNTEGVKINFHQELLASSPEKSRTNNAAEAFYHHYNAHFHW